MLVTKDDLKNSAYYAGAGIDIQPILRYGDYIKDFIYVSVGIEKNKLIEGIEHCIKSVNENLVKSSIKILSINNFKITDIEHDTENRLVSRIPDYFEEHQHRQYIENFSQFYNKRDDFNLKFDIELNIGGIIRQIRLIHLTGEALATYDVIFRKQQIAPKIFISIQTGLIEIPDHFSDKMFTLSYSKPKMWLRGVWNRDLPFYNSNRNVFKTYGIYDSVIGEFYNWNANFDYKIEDVTNPEGTENTVKAYGESKIWNYTPNTIVLALQNQGIVVNKIFGLFPDKRRIEYNSVHRHIALTRLNEIYDEFFNHDAQDYKVIIVPGGYEMYELYLNEFIRCFKPINDRKLTIDIYYEHISDLVRG